MKDFAAGA